MHQRQRSKRTRVLALVSREWAGGSQAPWTYAVEGCGVDGTIVAAWALGQRPMPLPWTICGSASTTAGDVQPQLADAHARLSAHMLSIEREHRPNRD